MSNFTAPKNKSKDNEEKLRKKFSAELRKVFDETDILKINPVDVPFLAKRVETAIYSKLIDKIKYERIMKRVLNFFKTIKIHRLINVGRYIKQNDFKPRIIGKLSQKTYESLRKIEHKLANQADSNKRNKMTKKFFQPFEENNRNFDPKIKKIKGSSTFDNNFTNSYYDHGKQMLSEMELKEKYLKKPNDFSDPFADDIKIKKSDFYNKDIEYENVEDHDDYEGFHFFKIFKGNFKIDLPDSKQNCDASLFTCAGNEFITYFTTIPDNLHLVTKVNKNEFHKYLDKALIQKQKKYLVLPGFIQTSADLALKSEMLNRSLVLSMSYSSKCKLFLFPKSFVKKDWLDILNLVVVRQEDVKVELFFFVVMKLNENQYEPKMTPMEVALCNGKKPYIVKMNVNEMVEQPLKMKNGELIVSPNRMIDENEEKTIPFPKDNQYGNSLFSGNDQFNVINKRNNQQRKHNRVEHFNEQINQASKRVANKKPEKNRIMDLLAVENPIHNIQREKDNYYTQDSSIYNQQGIGMYNNNNINSQNYNNTDMYQMEETYGLDMDGELIEDQKLYDDEDFNQFSDSEENGNNGLQEEYTG